MPIPIYLILADEKKRNGEVLFLQDTPGGVLHGLAPAAPDWRGETRVGSILSYLFWMPTRLYICAYAHQNDGLSQGQSIVLQGR